LPMTGCLEFSIAAANRKARATGGAYAKITL